MFGGFVGPELKDPELRTPEPKLHEGSGLGWLHWSGKDWAAWKGLGKAGSPSPGGRNGSCGWVGRKYCGNGVKDRTSRFRRFLLAGEQGDQGPTYTMGSRAPDRGRARGTSLLPRARLRHCVGLQCRLCTVGGQLAPPAWGGTITRLHSKHLILTFSSE